MTLEYSIKELPIVAKKLARQLKPGDIVAFSGELAAGKTTLIAALLKVLGYDDHVASPTFVIERRYPLKTAAAINEVVHLDFYRLTEKQLGSFDWQETIGNPKTLTLIEWPERVGRLLPAQTKTIKLKAIDDQTRVLTTSKNIAD